MSGILTPEVTACGFKVAKSCQRNYGLLLGSGTSALVLACKMVPTDRKKIIIPAIACTNILYAVLIAECTPVFVDVCPESGLIDPESVLSALEQDSGIGAVLVAHTFGHIADLQSIASYAKLKGVMVIEDAAQAYGGTYQDMRPLGALGDISLISFGHTKILDAGGGGVLMTDRIETYEACMAFALDLPAAPSDLESRFSDYRSRYYSEWSARSIDPLALRRIGMLHQYFVDTFLHRADDAMAMRIIALLPTLSLQVSARLELATKYAIQLSDLKKVRICLAQPGSVPWRFVFRVPAKERDALVDTLRCASVDVSCWYPSLANFYVSGDVSVKLPNAETFAQEVVNLWVTPGYDIHKVHLACSIICEQLA